MIRAEEISLYASLEQEKGLAEKVLGYTSFLWKYAKITYKADCTYGIPFDLFDKVIVGILQVEEVLSLEQIGEILGMNVIQDPDNFKIKDEAEYDILRMALDSLVDFEMIEVGDIYYSACRLTTIGKEYAAKGRKFRTERNKSFILYFDHISQDHLNAASHLRPCKGATIPFRERQEYNDEQLLKSMAAIQASHVYDVEKGNSFIHPEIDHRKSFQYEMEIQVVVLHDLERQASRLMAFDAETRKELPFASKWLQNHHLDEEIKKLSRSGNQNASFKQAFQAYCNYLIQASKEVFQTLQEDPEAAIAKTRLIYREGDFVDREYVWLHLKDFVADQAGEVYFFLSNPGSTEIRMLEDFARKAKKLTCYFILSPISEDLQEEPIITFSDQINARDSQQYALITKELEGTEIWFVEKDPDSVKRYIPVKVGLPVKSQSVEFKCFSRSVSKMEGLLPVTTRIKNKIATAIVGEVHTKVLNQVNTALADHAVSKEKIQAYAAFGQKMHPIAQFLENGVVKETYLDIETAVTGLLATKKEQLNEHVVEKTRLLLETVEKEEFRDLTKVGQFNEKAKALELELFPEFKAARKLISDLQKNLKSKERYIQKNLLAKTYVIDTNVFIDDPDIISKIDERDYVALSLMVIEELDRLKTKPETSDMARKAIRNIHTTLQTDNGNQRRVRRVPANLTLLPEELQTKSADNYILSIARAYQEKDKNPVLLTSDKNLQSKAMMLDIPVQSPGEIEVIEETPTPDYVKIFQNLRPNRYGDIGIASFIQEIKNHNPDFDFRALGYEKSWQFVEALQSFTVIEYQFMKLKK